MVLSYLDGISNVIDVKLPLTEIDKGVQHSESIVILTNIEASVMEGIHSSIVTVKPGKVSDKIVVVLKNQKYFTRQL